MFHVLTSSLLVVLLLLSANLVQAQGLYRITIRDRNAAKDNCSIASFGSNSLSQTRVNRGFANLMGGVGRYVLTMQQPEVLMTPGLLAYSFPENDGDTLDIITTLAPGRRNIYVLVGYSDTLEPTGLSATHFQFDLTGYFDTTLIRSYNSKDTVYGNVEIRCFDSVAFGPYWLSPRFDTLRFLNPNLFVSVAGEANTISYPAFVRERSKPKFSAYSYAIEQHTWTDPDPSDNILASGTSVDDDSWPQQLPFRFRLASILYDTILISSNGFITIEPGRDYPFHATSPISSTGYCRAAIAAIATDLNGSPTCRISVAEGVRQAKRTYSITWLNMKNYNRGLPSESRYSFRVTLVEDGSIGLVFGPMVNIDTNLIFECGIRGGDSRDIRSLSAVNYGDWLGPRVVPTAGKCSISPSSIPEPGLQVWFYPLQTSVEESNFLAPGNASPCPANAVVRLHRALAGELLQSLPLLLYSTVGTAVAVPCSQDGEDIILDVVSLVSGTYRTVINGRSYVLVVER